MPQIFSVALIDPDDAYARSLRPLLEREDFRVRWYSTTSSAAPGLQSGTFDLCLLTMEFPETDGIDICRTLRLSNVTVPIIAVTARFEEARRIEALGAGADDIVSKTMSGRELVARIRAVLRRSGRGSAGPAYEDDELSVLLDQMRVIANGQTILLSQGEARVLAVLIREAPAPVATARIYAELAAGQDRLGRTTIEARIKSLRRKLGSHRIETRPRLGYAFIGRSLRN